MPKKDDGKNPMPRKSTPVNTRTAVASVEKHRKIVNECRISVYLKPEQTATLDILVEKANLPNRSAYFQKALDEARVAMSPEAIGKMIAEYRERIASLEHLAKQVK